MIYISEYDPCWCILAHLMLEHLANASGSIDALSQDLTSQKLKLHLVRVDDNLLNNVRREFVLGEVQDLAVHLGDDLGSIGRKTLLDNELDHVVAILVLHAEGVAESA